MKSPEEKVDKAVEEVIKSEIMAKQHRENLKIQDALKKQEGWRDLIEDYPLGSPFLRKGGGPR